VTSDSASSSLPQLLALAKAKRAARFEFQDEVIALYDELRNRLLRYILSLGLSAADGEEILQEAFLALFQHLQQGRPRDNLRAWLFRVAHNQSMKRLNGNSRRSELFDASGDDAEVHTDPSPTPEEQVTFAQRQNRLLAVVQALPARDQQCLRLRAEGLRYREISDVLGISLGSVSASLARSLARLARADEK
jgi:RNA polymerase sigma-70 factor (ECF subfamily)